MKFNEKFTTNLLQNNVLYIPFYCTQYLKSYHLINKTHKINLINFVLQYLLLNWSHFIKNNIIRYLASLLTISSLFSLFY